MMIIYTLVLLHRGFLRCRRQRCLVIKSRYEGEPVKIDVFGRRNSFFVKRSFHYFLSLSRVGSHKALL